MGSNEHNYVHWGTINVASFLTDRWVLALSLCIADFTGSRRSSPGWGRGLGKGGWGWWLRNSRYNVRLSVVSCRAWATLAFNNPALTFILVSHTLPSSPSLASLEDARIPLAAMLESRLPLMSLWEPRPVCYTGKPGRWDWGRMNVSRDYSQEWDICRKHKCVLLCHLCSQRTSREKDAGTFRKPNRSAHLLALLQVHTTWRCLAGLCNKTRVLYQLQTKS